jgi:hypothetical protein
MEEDKCGMSFSILYTGGKKDLAMNLKAIGSGEDDLLWFDELRTGVIGRKDLRCQIR